jgi:hypothetical protein
VHMASDNGSGHTLNGGMSALQTRLEEPCRVHPAWVAFMHFCGKLQHGEIACLKIQDGLPVVAEVTTRKIKFT